MKDTIFALSSGAPPAAVAVVRISGPGADAALMALAGALPEPRRASLRTLRAADGAVLDSALVLRFPGPRSATGEALAELHLHGGRATVAAVLEALAALPGLRLAEAGEFTRRALANGRIDLAEAEGLADLLHAETEAQRRLAWTMASGGLSRAAEGWRTRLVAASARVEAAIDFADEADIMPWPVAERRVMLGALADEVSALLAQPPAERLRDGVRVAIAGPPNAGKSTLFNALAAREAAIVSPIAGTTRDLIEAPVVLGGLPVVLIDMSGLRDATDDPIEAIGIARARGALTASDVLLWLGPPKDAPDHPARIQVAAKADIASHAGLAVSAVTGQGMRTLKDIMDTHIRGVLPSPGALAVNVRQHTALTEAEREVRAAADPDLLIAAEHLRLARLAIDRVVGRADVEDVLDALFAGFCIGK